MGHVCIRASVILALSAAPALCEEAGNDVLLLRDGVTSDSYELRLVAETYRAHVTFHPDERFFILEGTDFLKFDAGGQEVFRLANSAEIFRPHFSPYAATAGEICDFTQQPPRPQPFAKIVNGDKNRRLSRDDFFKQFGQAYAEADVVVYGRYNFDVSKTPAYLRIADDWIVFYVANRDIDDVGDGELGYTIEGFPAKYRNMILLRDPVRKHYAHASSRLREGAVPLPEDRLKYPRDRKLSRLSYNSEYVSEELAYTSIPAVKAGYATHRLSVDGETMDFREIAVRATFSFRVESNLSLFVLPEPYARDVPVSFLEFHPGNNIDTGGSDGVYVLRPKR